MNCRIVVQSPDGNLHEFDPCLGRQIKNLVIAYGWQVVRIYRTR